MAGRRGIGAATVMALALLGAACSDDGDAADVDSAGRPVLPDEVVCNLVFRAQEGTLVGYEEAEVRVERGDGGLEGNGAEQAIGTMRFAVTYAGDVPEGRVVHVRVFGADGTAIVRALYPVGDEFPEFGAGHGFTGLHYVNDGEAELQFICYAE